MPGGGPGKALLFVEPAGMWLSAHTRRAPPSSRGSRAKYGGAAPNSDAFHHGLGCRCPRPRWHRCLAPRPSSFSSACPEVLSFSYRVWVYGGRPATMSVQRRLRLHLTRRARGSGCCAPVAGRHPPPSSRQHVVRLLRGLQCAGNFSPRSAGRLLNFSCRPCPAASTP